MACELPEKYGRSLCLWDCKELARQLISDGVVENISSETVRCILKSHKLKPWRYHFWLGEKTPRDQEFYDKVSEICDLYTRELREDETVICIDEKTSIQARSRLTLTKAAQPEKPVLIEHEYKRCGALNLIAAFDTRSGTVYGRCYGRKRQIEFIDFLENMRLKFPDNIKHIHVVLDNVPMHKGKKVRAWLEKHPEFHFHFLPVHCSWLNQIEQWFSTLQFKRLRVPDFSSLKDLEVKVLAFISHHNQYAHPYKWKRSSGAKVLAKRKVSLPIAA
ncbi:MAG: IS630 family transposase [Candidatus Eremiobacterota bacterium]